MSRAAVIRARRTYAGGGRLLQVVCPLCEHRHWLPDEPTGFCPRKHGSFTIAGGGIGG